MSILNFENGESEMCQVSVTTWTGMRLISTVLLLLSFRRISASNQHSMEEYIDSTANELTSIEPEKIICIFFCALLHLTVAFIV